MDGGAWWLQSLGSQRVGHDWMTDNITQYNKANKKHSHIWARGRKECLDHLGYQGRIYEGRWESTWSVFPSVSVMVAILLLLLYKILSHMSDLFEYSQHTYLKICNNFIFCTSSDSVSSVSCVSWILVIYLASLCAWSFFAKFQTLHMQNYRII